jgi:hypothetical protein
MKTKEIIDYAYPCMMAERGLKKAHDALLDNDYDAAIEHTLAAITEAKMMYNSIKIMQEKSNALRDQTSSV